MAGHTAPSRTCAWNGTDLPAGKFKSVHRPVVLCYQCRYGGWVHGVGALINVAVSPTKCVMYV